MKSHFLIFLLIIALAGCIYPGRQGKELDCPPPPPQNCFPAKWEGIPLDTSVESSRELGYYYRIDPVQGVNTESDEWDISFLDNNRAAITYSDNATQRMIMARLILPAKFRPEGGLFVPFRDHAGDITKGKDLIAFAAAPSIKFVPIGAEPSVDGLIRLPLDNAVGHSRIFTGNYADDKISNVEEISFRDFASELDWVAQPALSDDGNVIFFASDEKSGMGGTDIWYCYKTEDGWSEPVNCGPNVNTACDELTPHVFGDRLYFSSAGGKTVGGYDIFKSNIDKKFFDDIKNNTLDTNAAYFSDSENPGRPLNTQADELFPSCYEDCDSILYYSSNQAAFFAQNSEHKPGGFDLFVFYKEASPYVDFYEPAKKEFEEKGPDISIDYTPDLSDLEVVETYEAEGSVYDKQTNQPVSDADITVKELPDYNEKLKTKTDNQGKFKVELDKSNEYEIVAESNDLFYDTKNVYVDITDTTKKLDLEFYLPEKLELRINFPTDYFNEPYTYVLDSTGVETMRTWQRELETLADNLQHSTSALKKIVLVGHTDDVASVEYNNELGRKRVEFVIDELVKRGVKREILEGRSAGELEPLPRKSDEDLELYRKRLRRVTIEKIMKSE